MSTVSSLNTSTLAAYALSGLRDASQQISRSVERLSTGSRLTRAGDDVAALSIVTRLKSDRAALTQAASNSALGTSMLQIAYDGLRNISDILNRQKAIATQATSGGLTASDYAMLDLEFQDLTAEIDRIATGTSFNGITLLDGSQSAEAVVTTNTTAATAATGSLTFASNVVGGETLSLNGTTITFGGGGPAVGGTIQASLDNLVNFLNTSTNTNLSVATYSRVGNALSISYDAGGTTGNQYVINQGASTSGPRFTVAGGSTNSPTIFTLSNGLNNGISGGGTRGSGTIGDNILTAQNQVAASTTLSVTGTITDGETLRIDSGIGGFAIFTFRNAPATSTEIQIGATTQDTARNAINTIRAYLGTNVADYGARQLEMERSGDDITFRYLNTGNPLDLVSVALNTAETMANGVFTTTTLNNGATGGITTNGITNSAFVGTVQGFTASYVSPNTVDLSLTVGNSTYTATAVNTLPGANTTVRLNSTNGGFFDIQLAAGNGTAVSDATTATGFASRINAAFAGVSFYQQRFVSSFDATGQLAGASASLTSNGFDDLRAEDVQVTAAPSSTTDAVIEVTINGEVYRSQAGLGTAIGAREAIRLVNQSDVNKVLTLQNGTTAIDLSTSGSAAIFAASLRSNLDVGENGAGALSFQVGSVPDDTIDVSLASVSSARLFGGSTPQVNSAVNATTAGSLVDDALTHVNGQMARVGAAQSRLEIASTSLANTLLYTDEARATLEDTDIAAESSLFATAQVRAQASISVLAQTSRLSSDLLDLLKAAA